MDLAIKIAESNDTYEKWKLACVIVKGGSVLAVGQSKLRCNPAHCDFEMPGIRERVSLHAEADALSRCGNPKGATLYVARIGRAGHVRLAKPCKGCQEKLLDAGIKKVYYSISETDVGTWPPER